MTTSTRVLPEPISEKRTSPDVPTSPSNALEDFLLVFVRFPCRRHSGHSSCMVPRQRPGHRFYLRVLPAGYGYNFWRANTKLG